MRKAIALAGLLIGTAAPALSQAPDPIPDWMAMAIYLRGSMNIIRHSYSGEIHYKGDGYSVTAVVDMGAVVCSGGFQSGDQTLVIGGKGKLDLDLEINGKHQYQFFLHCPYPTGYNEGLQELGGSYEQYGGKVDFNPATCTPQGRPKPGQSGDCTLIWPDRLAGGWSYPEEGQMTWALCQKASSLDNPRRECKPPPPPPPPPPPEK